MSKIIWFSLLILILILGCKPAQDESFQLFYQNFQKSLEETPMLQAFVEERLIIDDKILIPTERQVLQILEFSKDEMSTLHTFELDRLNPVLHEHFHNTHRLLEIVITNIDSLKVHEQNTEMYHVFRFLPELLPLGSPDTLSSNLQKITTLYQVAIENLHTPDSLKLEQSLTENIEVFQLLDADIRSDVKKSNIQKEKKEEIEAQLDKALLALKNYIAYCNSKLFEIRNKKLESN